jgi:cation transport regulator ChaB
MPKDGDEDLPSTLQKSPAKAKRTWREAHDSAVDTYGEGERAHRTAYSALKHSFEKKGDRWEPKGRKGPSDPQAKRAAPPPAGHGAPPTAASTPSATPSRSCTSAPSSWAWRAARA